MQVRIRTYRDLGVAIRSAREQRGETQEALAERLGFHRNYLINMERGIASLPITRLFRVLNLLGITITVSWGIAREETHAER